MPKQEEHIDFSWISDPYTEPMLLPSSWNHRDNSRRVAHYKRALRQGIRRCLTPKQQEIIRLYYGSKMNKSEIAALHHSTCSAIGKSLKSAERTLQNYVEFYMDIYTRLEQELLNDEWR